MSAEAEDFSEPSESLHHVVRFMINPEATKLDDGSETPLGIDFPVGWAVRGYTAEELERRNRTRELKDPLRNKLNMLPVFRGDFKPLKDAVPPQNTEATPQDGKSAKPKKELRRFYYICNDPEAQLLSPKSLIEQVREAQSAAIVSRDNEEDIMDALWKVSPSAKAAVEKAQAEAAKERIAKEAAQKEADTARTKALTDALAPLKNAETA